MCLRAVTTIFEPTKREAMNNGNGQRNPEPQLPRSDVGDTACAHHTVITRSEKETEQLGARLGRRLRPGTVVALYGDLGAGKTVLARGVARGLDIEEPVTSPTFTVVQEYETRHGFFLFHLDMYRIDNSDAALAFGIEEYLFAADGVTLVEWPEQIADLLQTPGNDPGVLVTLRIAAGNRTERRISLPERVGREIGFAG